MTLLVSGASGNLGSRVVQLLREAGHDVIPGSRTPPEGGRKVDFDDPDLAKSFEGIDRLLIISTDELSVPGKRLQQHRNAIAAAEAAGVRHVVYTSIVQPSPANPCVVVPDHLGTEAALAASGLSFTVLRNALYAEVPLMGLEAAKATGKWFHATDGRGTAYISREDCARAAAAALAADDWTRSVVDITGPEALTANRVAGILGEALGQTFEPVNLTTAQLAAGMAQGGMPEPFAQAMATFDQSIAEGYLETVSDGFERLTGRAPEAFADFAARTFA